MDLVTLPVRSDELPLQYPSLSASFSLYNHRHKLKWFIVELGYSTEEKGPSLEQRKRAGEALELTLANQEPEAAPAPPEVE